jgi:quaternary ammonium compound-resistance protein SugE
MKYWISLLVASCWEVCWIYSLKYISWEKIKAIKLAQLFHGRTSLEALLPVLGYILFGVLNISFFSYAMKGIPASTAFAVWMGLALVFSKICDIYFFNQAFSYMQVASMLFILVGMVGLKVFEGK